MYTHANEIIWKMWNTKRKVYAPKENCNEKRVTRENKNNVNIVCKKRSSAWRGLEQW